MFILIIYFQKLNALILLIILPIDAFICYIEYKRFVENMNNI